MANVVSRKRTRAKQAFSVGDKLSVKVYKAMKRDIIRGIHPTGEPLTEKELAKQYKSSRTPVREAALRLQEDRLLRIVPQPGLFCEPDYAARAYGYLRISVRS